MSLLSPPLNFSYDPGTIVTKSPVTFVGNTDRTSYGNTLAAVTGQALNDVALVWGWRQFAGGPGVPSGYTDIAQLNNGGSPPLLSISRRILPDGTTFPTFAQNVVYCPNAVFRNAVYANADTGYFNADEIVITPTGNTDGPFETNSMAVIEIQINNTATVLQTAFAAAFPDWTIRDFAQSGPGTGYVLATKLVGATGVTGGTVTLAAVTNGYWSIIVMEPVA